MTSTNEFGTTTEVLRSRTTQAIVLAYLAVGLWYLSWRTMHTVNLDAPFLSVPLLLADFLGFGFFILFAVGLWSRVRRFAPPPEQGLLVDVFIPTFNEPLEILKPTILSALAMDYPHRTYVLDDGRREDVREACRSLGAEYLTRTSNDGAKAGNINAALKVTGGDLIAIFDADHAPFRSLLTELLGYFRDPKIALVQAPQAYFNLDSFQHRRDKKERGKPWHEQSVFYDMIMPGKDRMNAAFWCGSTAIIRRDALEQIGGVDTTTVTEDMHTAMKMHAAGWKSIYHDRELAVGIAPDDLEPFLVQRRRWAQGAMEILRRDNPLRRRGLTFRQRIAYFTSTAYVIEYVPKAVYLVVPPLTLATGILPMSEMGWNLLFRFGPYYLLGMLAAHRLSAGRNPLFQSERFHLLKMVVMLQALSLLVWPRKLRFKVTEKSASGQSHRIGELRYIRWQLGVGVFCAGAALWGVAGWMFGAPWALKGPSLALTVAWAAINAGVIATVARAVLRRQHRRNVFRFALELPLTVSVGSVEAQTRTTDVSASGLGWMSERWYREGQKVRVSLQTHVSDSPIVSTAEVAACLRVSPGRFRVGAAFTEMTQESERRLILTLFQAVAPASISLSADRPQPAAA